MCLVADEWVILGLTKVTCHLAVIYSIPKIMRLIQ